MTSTRLLLAALLASASLPALAQTGSTPYSPADAPSNGPESPAAAGRMSQAAFSQAAPAASRVKPVIHSDDVPTLNDALAEVYLTNPALLAERAKLRATDETVPAALSGWRPQVSVTLSPGWGYGSIKDYTDPFAGIQHQDQQIKNDRFEHSETIQISQSVYRGGRTTSAVAQATNNVRGERARLLGQEEQSFSDAVTAYVTVIEDQQLYELQVSNVDVLTKDLDATNARFSVGEITRTDVAQAQAALAGAISQRETALGNLESARATYRDVIGELPDKLIEPQPLVLPVSSAAEADRLASTNNASVVAATYDDAAAQDAVDAAYANLMPQVQLQASAANNTFSSSVQVSSNGGTIGGTITIPIYQGGSEYAAIRQAKQTEQETRKNLDVARRAAIEQATQNWETYIAAKSSVASDRAQVRADEIALDGVEREALAGTQTTLDVLNAEQLLLSAQVTLVQNLASLVSGSYGVAGAIGRLTARDLGLHVPFYDEKAYYRAVRDLGYSTNDQATNQPGR